MEIAVRTRCSTIGHWHCWTTLPLVGEVVVGSGRTPEQAQYQAAKFLDVNYPESQVDWTDGYRGGDTSSKTAAPYSQYWGD